MDFEKKLKVFIELAQKKAIALLKTTLGLSLIVGLVFLVMFFFACFRYIKPYEFGVKQVNIGLKRGIQEKIYNTGLHFIMPFGFEEMHRFPKDIQLYDLASNQPGRSQTRSKAAYIQTSDGFFVDVDVSILYRISDPVAVIKSIGPGRLYEDNGLAPKAEPALKDSLGKLTTEEFYNSIKRVEKMLVAKDKLNSELLEKGIKVEHVLIRYFRYSNEIQKNIEDKKLKDQLVFKNQAEARSAIEEAQLKKVTEEGEALYQVELEKGNAYRVEKLADKDLYVRKKRANADLLIKLAEAEKTRLKNNALLVQGANNLVGLEMAKVLGGIDVIVLPSDGNSGVNPLNLNQLKGLFE